MAINEWWAADSGQRFWMEITDRYDLGADLFAPTTDGRGRPYWGYELITYVQPGDIILHWHKTLAGEPAPPCPSTSPPGHPARPSRSRRRLAW